jgi:cell wall-associated NlpC family hydrolase
LPHVDQSELVPGDLLFFYSPIHHVGMYVGNGRMIHSPRPGSKVSIVKIAQSGWIKEYAGAIRYF